MVITGQNQDKKVMVLEWKEHRTIEDSWALSLWRLLESKSCHFLSGIWLFLDWSLKLKKAGPSFLKDHLSFSPLLFRILANCSLTLSSILLLEFYVFSKSMWNTEAWTLLFIKPLLLQIVTSPVYDIAPSPKPFTFGTSSL